jgi:hypothetical protein
MARYEISIEIRDGEFSASSWLSAYGDRITSTAVEHGAVEWRWLHRSWGIVCEIAFAREREYDRWRAVPGVVSAFDAVPDPVKGLIFHRGWGGTSGSGQPRKPRPLAGAGAAEIEFDDVLDRVTDAVQGDRRRTAVIEPDESHGAAASI